MSRHTEVSIKEAAPDRAWKQALAEAVRDPDQLVALLGLPEECREGARRAARRFPLLVPRSFLARMRRGEPQDPLLRQVLPMGEELEERAGYGADPVGEASAIVAPGLLQKYEGRALLVTTGTCAVHCRYCFRREFPYNETPRGLEAWRPTLARLAADTSVTEVILSGGDPLVLGDAALEELVQEVATIRHVRRLRLHTRLPVVVPERVTDRLLLLLRATRLTPVVVVHANHPHELEAPCGEALERLVDAGIPTLNQAVLLRGVNDSAEILARLSERLLELRVLPYYLHQLDHVRGAAHFHVEEERGREILAELRRRLPGYAVPRYVREVGGETSKVPL